MLSVNLYILSEQRFRQPDQLRIDNPEQIG
jgi:hypothetical protein